MRNFAGFRKGPCELPILLARWLSANVIRWSKQHFIYYMEYLKHILEYSALISLLIAAFAFGAIKSYLVNRDLVKWKLAYWNPFDFFGKYIEFTKEATGKIGIWFKVMIWAGIFAIILGLSEGLINFVRFVFSNISQSQ